MIGNIRIQIGKIKENNKQDLVFTVSKNTKNPATIYVKVWFEFDRLLRVVDMADKKEEVELEEKKNYYPFFEASCQDSN